MTMPVSRNLLMLCAETCCDTYVAPMTSRLPYRFGNRPVERIIAFALTTTLVVWFMWKSQHISVATGTGLLFAVVATFVARTRGM